MAAQALSSDELARDLQASFGSLLGTLTHIVWGERGWLQFWQRGTFLPDPVPGEYPDLPTLRSAWAGHDSACATYLQGLTQEDLNAPRSVGRNSYTLAELIQHILNHSTYHRGQVALLMRQLGYKPPSTDYRRFLTVTRGGTA